MSNPINIIVQPAVQTIVLKVQPPVQQTIRINVAGILGPIGPIGPQGIQGPQGPQGEPGETATVPTNISAFTNDVPYLIQSDLLPYLLISNYVSPVNADWSASSGLAHILNKPSIPVKVSDLTNDSAYITIADVPKNVANGYAGLDGNIKIPAILLPAYVDDVLEFANLAGFPSTGTTGIIYVAIDSNKTYRWSGSTYIEISPSPGSTDSLAEGSVNLYYLNSRVLSFMTGKNVSIFVNDAGYLTTEADPVYTGSSWYSTTNNSANWNTAFGWGNHAGLYALLSGSYNDPTWITALAWSKISSKPTTLSGYGITDAYTKTQSDGRYLQSYTETDPVWLSEKTNYYTKVQADGLYVALGGSYADPSWITSLDWSKIANTPTTLSGYGITDAYTKTASDARYLQSFTETDPVWTAASGNYYTKTQADARYLQSFTETDPVWISEKTNYYTKTAGDARYALVSSSYADPSWITSLAWSKISGAPAFITSAAIASLTDVTLTSIADGNFLRYDNATSKWLNVLLVSADIPSLDMAKITTGNLSWTRVSSTPTTIAGYGITDAYTKTASDARYLQTIAGITAGGDLSGTYVNPSVTGLLTKALPTLSTGLLKYNGTLWVFDTNTYLTGNQTITLSGDVTGSGATAITATVVWANGNTTYDTRYVLTAGVAGGQTINGGTAASENLTLKSTAHATKGFVYIGTTSAFDETNARLGVGIQAPTVTIHALATTEQLRLGYDASNFSSFTTSSTGGLTISPSSGVCAILASIQTAATGTNSDFFVGASTIATQSATNAQYVFAGATTVSFRAGFRGSASPTITSTNSYSAVIIGQQVAGIAASGTHALFASLVIKAPSITATGGTGVLTNSATLYLEGQPAGATNNYVLWTAAGTTRIDGTTILSDGTVIAPSAKLHVVSSTEQLRLGFDASNLASFTVGSTGNLTIAMTTGSTGGAIFLNGAFASATSIAGANFWVASSNGTSTTTQTQYLFNSITTLALRVGIRGSTNSSIGAGNSYASFIIGQEPVTIAASGTHLLFAQTVIRPLAITAGVGALTNSASFYIEDAATGATNNYSMWVAAGVSKIDGGIVMNATALAATAILQADSTTKGWLPPRMTNTQRLAISSPATGLFLYQTDSVEGMYVSQSGGWVNLDQRASISTVASDVTTTGATATNITGLSAAVKISTKYRFHAILYVGCSSTGGIKFAVTGPTGATLFATIIQGTSSSANGAMISKITAFATLNADVFCTVNTTTGKIEICGYFTTDGTNAGTFQLQFASGTAGQTSTIFATSNMDISEVK